MNIPQITGIDTALKIYYTHSEIGNKEIALLFGHNYRVFQRCNIYQA
jgi:pectin methylesterase-like acyl-CoA thioesterase